MAGRNQCPERPLSLAGFQLITVGRFWVITEALRRRADGYHNVCHHGARFMRDGPARLLVARAQGGTRGSERRASLRVADVTKGVGTMRLLLLVLAFTVGGIQPT